MNKQNPWLFEAPLAPSSTFNRESYSNPAWEAEWESQITNPYTLEREQKYTVANRTAPPRKILLPPPPQPLNHKRYSVPPKSKLFKASYAVPQKLQDREVAYEYPEPQKRWLFWDVWWLNPSSNQYELLEQAGPWLGTSDDKEKIRFTLQIKWSPRKGGKILARCFAYNPSSSQWLACQNYYF